MNPFLFIYTEALWRPLFNGLIWFYTVLPVQDIGLAIVCMTVAIRFLLSPLLLRARKAQQDLAKIQPELKKIQERYKKDPSGQAQAMKELYAMHHVNPFSGCLILLVQLPILLALFGVFRGIFDPSSLSYLYVPSLSPGAVDPLGFGFLNLSEKNIFFGAISAAIQFIQMRFFSVTPPPQAEGKFDIARMMQWQIPFIVLIASLTLPASLVVYWTVSNLFDIMQEIILRRMRRSAIPTPSAGA